MIKKPKVAIFSDLHLGLYGNSVEWHEIALKWADWITTDLKKKKITDIFFLGDFFHNRSEISVQTIHVASELITKFKDFNLLMIVGNHDAYYKNRSDVHSLGFLKGHDNITIIDDNLEMEAFGKKLLFVPWNHDLSDGKFDHIFGHFEIQSFKMNNYKVCDHGFQVMDFLAFRTANVWSGHFHLRSSKKYNEGLIRYVGNTFHHDFNDTGDDKGYHILNLEDDSVEFVKNTVSPEFVKIPLSKLKDWKAEDVEGNIVKLIIDKDVEDDKVEKFKIYLNNFSPFRLTTEYNVATKTIGDVEQVDSIDLMEMFDEFYEQLNLDEEQLKRVKKINDEMYERCKS
jgi:DNA repair exonuclease SbcCD nuclease subunit